jgi:hypothetical protein
MNIERILRGPTRVMAALPWLRAILLMALLAILPRPVLALTSADGLSSCADNAQPAPPGEAGKGAASPVPTKILCLWGRDAFDHVIEPNADGLLHLRMGDSLFVGLDGTGPLAAEKFVLYLNGQAVSDPSLVTFHEKSEKKPRALAFRLRRIQNDKNIAAAWAALLGSAVWSLQMEVSVDQKDQKNGQRLVGVDAKNTTFEFDIFETWWFLAASILAAVVLFGLLYAARKTPIVRDNLLPQIPWRQRQFSLGYCQMAFWFALVFISFLFLWALLWDYNTLTTGALTLMGIAAGTGLGAIMANTTNTGPVEDADKRLRDAGFSSRRDIESLVQDLDQKAKLLQEKHQQLQTYPNTAAQLQRSGKPADPNLNNRIQQLPTEITELNAEIKKVQDRKAIYDAATANYISATYNRETNEYEYRKFFMDLITDRDGGTVLYRVQILAWTVVLGLVFLAGVYRDVSMPDFNTTLLTLMAISGGSYIGFKFAATT